MGDTNGVRRTIDLRDKIVTGTEAWFDDVAVGCPTVPTSRAPLCKVFRTLSLAVMDKVEQGMAAASGSHPFGRRCEFARAATMDRLRD
ncbi:hypothetical protein E2562_011083 [Oryza meyeriana var. granulata]|uniref:Uncharacterized protein n=1 Tax=Oryza meyeriana var. granulata TaxID=110450 RepID=A0A6G1EWK5_9ORYZ|nr:hypothetical protein E2562_011083 [Oryza meyeriana var. granulata]